MGVHWQSQKCSSFQVLGTKQYSGFLCKSFVFWLKCSRNQRTKKTQYWPCANAITVHTV